MGKYFHCYSPCLDFLPACIVSYKAANTTIAPPNSVVIVGTSESSMRPKIVPYKGIVDKHGNKLPRGGAGTKEYHEYNRIKRILQRKKWKKKYKPQSGL